MKKKLQLSKEKLKTLSSTQLVRVAGGTQAADDTCVTDCGAGLFGGASLDGMCNML